MQDFIILASSDNDLMKFLFVGIWLLVVFGGAILKMLGFSNDNKDGNPQPKKSKPNFAGNAKPTKIDDDMAKARRRLQEMIRERKARESNLFGSNYEEIRPVFEEPEVLVNHKPESPKEEVADSAYSQNAFDYDTQLKETQRLLAESEIAYKKVANNATFEKGEDISEIGIDIKATEIRDFVHNKTMLKKSIVIAEILDKPLSLR